MNKMRLEVFKILAEEDSDDIKEVKLKPFRQYETQEIPEEQTNHEQTESQEVDTQDLEKASIFFTESFKAATLARRYL